MQEMIRNEMNFRWNHGNPVSGDSKQQNGSSAQKDFWEFKIREKGEVERQADKFKKKERDDNSFLSNMYAIEQWNRKQKNEFKIPTDYGIENKARKSAL